MSKLVERLEEIIKLVRRDARDESGFYCPLPSMTSEEALKALLEAFRQVVPEARNDAWTLKNGWNACREQLLKELGD